MKLNPQYTTLRLLTYDKVYPLYCHNEDIFSNFSLIINNDRLLIFILPCNKLACVFCAVFSKM